MKNTWLDDEKIIFIITSMMYYKNCKIVKKMYTKSEIEDCENYEKQLYTFINHLTKLLNTHTYPNISPVQLIIRSKISL